MKYLNYASPVLAALFVVFVANAQEIDTVVSQSESENLVACVSAGNMALADAQAPTPGATTFFQSVKAAHNDLQGKNTHEIASPTQMIKPNRQRT